MLLLLVRHRWESLICSHYAVKGLLDAQVKEVMVWSGRARCSERIPMVLTAG